MTTATKKRKVFVSLIFEGEFETCAHRVTFWYDVDELGEGEVDDKTKEILTEEAENRAKDCIVEGCVAGELNCCLRGETEVRGWWEIDRS